MENKKYYRNVIITSKDMKMLQAKIREIYGWKYREDIEEARHFPFCLLNEQLGYIVSFETINEITYRSINVLRYDNEKIQLPEIINVKNVCEDILLKLCVDIINQFKDRELYCGIVPDIKDYIST